MDALYEDKDGKADTEWNGPDSSLTTNQVIHEGDPLRVAGNAMYRIFRRVGAEKRDEVFRFALEVDKRRATSLGGFRYALIAVAEEDQFSAVLQQAVAAVLVDMGINGLPVGTTSVTMLRFIEAKMRALFAAYPNDGSIGAAVEEAMRRLREYFGLDNDQVLRGG